MRDKFEGRCCRCKEIKPVADFARDASKSNGRKSLCKSCDNAKSKAYYAANRERRLAYMNERNRRRREQAAA